MKRYLSILVAILMLMAMIPSAGAEENVEVTLLQGKVEIAAALQAYADHYNAITPGVTVKIESVGGGNESWATVLAAKAAQGDVPTMFNIDGYGDYLYWKDYIAPIEGAKWADDTDYELVVDGAVYGFPVAIEGYGLGYNAELLEKAGIDPKALTTFSALKEAFEKLDGMKEELGIVSVSDFGASVAGGMTGKTGNQLFSVYFGAGKDIGDKSLVERFNAGDVDLERLNHFADYVKLLADYSEYEYMLNGNYDDELNRFVNRECVFINEGNWIDPSLKAKNIDFAYGFISTPIDDAMDYTGLYAFAPAWYVISNTATEQEQQAAKAFLDSLVYTEEGHDYMVNQAGMISAFRNVKLSPSGGLSKCLYDAIQSGDTYPFLFGYMPAGTGKTILCNIFELFAQDTSGDAQKNFVNDIAAVSLEISTRK